MSTPTKALVLLTTRFDYDGGEILGCRVAMVPMAFDAEADEAAFYVNLRGSPLYGGWYTRKGKLHGRYVNKARLVWEANVALRYGDTVVALKEWNV